MKSICYGDHRDVAHRYMVSYFCILIFPVQTQIRHFSDEVVGPYVVSRGKIQNSLVLIQNYLVKPDLFFIYQLGHLSGHISAMLAVLQLGVVL